MKRLRFLLSVSVSSLFPPFDSTGSHAVALSPVLNSQFRCFHGEFSVRRRESKGRNKNCIKYAESRWGSRVNQIGPIDSFSYLPFMSLLFFGPTLIFLFRII